MQLKPPKFFQRNPTQFHRFGGWFERDRLAGGGAGKHGGVGPAGGCASGDDGFVNDDKGWIDAALLDRFAQGCFLNCLVRVAGAAGQSPRAAISDPVRAVLQEHRVPGAKEEAGRTLLAPDLFAVWAVDPTVTVAFHKRHPTREWCLAPPVTCAQ